MTRTAGDSIPLETRLSEAQDTPLAALAPGLGDFCMGIDIVPVDPDGHSLIKIA